MNVLPDAGTDMISHSLATLLLGAAGAVIGAATATAHSVNPAIGLLWQLVGCLAGALTSVWLQPYQNMKPWEIVASVAVAFGFSFFVTPLFFPIDGSRESGGRFYAMATASFILIPVLLKKAKDTARNLGGGSLTEKDE